MHEAMHGPEHGEQRVHVYVHFTKVTKNSLVFSFFGGLVLYFEN